MSIKKFFAEKDNTITNAYPPSLVSRATGSNMGASDVLEVFSLYGQESDSSVERSRVLIQFPVSKITDARTAGSIPASGSVNFYLRLFNAEHTSTTPKDFTIKTNPITEPWDEGIGLDMETYSDKGTSNWSHRVFNTPWTTAGGQYNTDAAHEKEFKFDSGTEDALIDITDVVEKWADGTLNNYGLIVRLDTSAEDGSLERSFYTKKFFARGSEYYLKRPVIEARWDDSSVDSSLLPSPYVQADEYVANITNLKNSYKDYESARLKVHTRKRDWQPNIYNVAIATSSVDLISEMYYKVSRVSDDLEVISYSTASTPSYSKMSYNEKGSYFDLDMSVFEKNYMYQINFLRKDGTRFIELKDKFRFRVD